MKLFLKFISSVALLFAAIAQSLAQDGIVATPDHANGVYREGETVHWQIKVTGDDADSVSEIAYTIKKGGLTQTAEGTLSLNHGEGTLTGSLDQPGTLLASFKAGSRKGLGGAIFAPEKIKGGAPCPDDFDAFWSGKLKDLAAIPPNPLLTSAPSDKPEVDYSKITLDNINGTHVQGQIARPKSGEKFPALLQVQYAGVYPLQKSWVTDLAAKGWLAMNIMAHDLPIDQPEEFYKQQAAGPLKNYTTIGSESRETSYFVRMFLGCVRAAEYLSSRPDWDGRTFVVTGTSQGGLQSFVTAALFPKVTAVIVEVPAGCDPNASDAGRAFGWPYWAASHSDKVMETSRYFDAVHFAARTKCPLLVGVGLIDTTAPVGAVYAAFNAAPGPKEIVPMPLGDHKRAHEAFHPRRNAWLKALVTGAVPLVTK